MSIRNKYIEYGVSKYYEQNKNSYINPHYDDVKNCLTKILSKINIKNYLDLGCGNGEITTYLNNKGYSKVMGCDPYFYEIYTQKTGKFCLKDSFEYISLNGLPFTYETIIASYSIHLCLSSFKKQLLYELSKACKNLVIISPNNNYKIDEHFKLIEEIVQGKSHCKIYKSTNEYT